MPSNGVLVEYPKFQAFADDATFLIGGKLYSYETRTSTPKPLYKDWELLVEHTNPVILDARGEVTLYGHGFYKLRLYRPDDTLVWEVDPWWFPIISDFWLNLFNNQTLNETLIDLEMHKHSYQMDPPDIAPSETPDRSRTTFTTSHVFVAGTLRVFVNGLLQKSGRHFSEGADHQSYTFDVGAPLKNWVLQHEYLVDLTTI